MTNPYLIEGPALISFSGGRTSAYMLHQIVGAHGGRLPNDVHVVFANTGKEREETLRFVHECATRWDVEVIWLEWRRRERGDPWEGGFERVGYNSAARQGEPFARLIKHRGFLPNAVTRFCTQELKVRPMQHFMRALGHAKYRNVVGLRADEMHRVARLLGRNGKDGMLSLAPLATAGVSERDVRAFWREQEFDLQLLPFEGNCDGCFLKARPKLWEIERTKPGTLDWWAGQERSVSATAKCGRGQFVTEYGYAELIQDVRRQPDMFAGGLFDSDPEMDRRVRPLVRRGGVTKRDLEAEIVRLHAALAAIVEVGTKTTAVRIGDMYDMEGGYDDIETVSDEAEIAAAALASMTAEIAHLTRRAA